ncbi:extracellular solute-binding protein [Komagataeibacter xylinus]|uniref:extracellular solute-binding protein n=1 Tax=Komagataeibacter xylinus TaxID=28448 RepID=UPI00077309DD|nr:extracellular solute-binding protein [Komagataeibacter xylinus]GBQ70839.1 spermidine/putrescine ABC transporter substrate-binding periplasmic protein [Komagataeibacter xylinus NBRC 15237]
MFQIVSRRSLSAILPGLLVALTALPVPVAGVQAAARIHHGPALVVASTEPQLAPAQDVAFFQPFRQATGQSVTRRAWTGALPDLESHGVQAGGSASAWSLVFAEDTTIRAACMQGLVVHLAGSATNPDGCGAPGLATQVVVAWDQTWRDSAPRWNDFWDIVRFPGKRGLRRDPRTTLEIALLADGVPPAQVYGQLATPQGVDRAFRKLSQLRPYITWWSTPNEAASLLSRKQVLMGSAPREAVDSLATRGEPGRIGINADMALSYDLSWAVVAGQSAERLGRSRDLLHFIVQPDRQAAFVGAAPAGPSTPAHPAALLPVDVQFWQVNYAPLSRRFALWLRKAG